MYNYAFFSNLITLHEYISYFYSKIHNKTKLLVIDNIYTRNVYVNFMLTFNVALIWAFIARYFQFYSLIFVYSTYIHWPVVRIK